MFLLFVTPRTAALQPSLSITNAWSLLRLVSIELVMPSNHLILCHLLLHLPSIFPSIRAFQIYQFFTSGGQSIGVSASASVLPTNIQDWSPLGWIRWISLQSKGLSRVISNTTVQKHQFFGAQLSLLSNSHIHTCYGKTIALTRWTFVSKVISMLFNMLSRLVITFLPRSKHLLISLRYDLNQIPYNYTVEVMNRLQWLGLVDSAWRTMDRGSWHCTAGKEQDHPQEKEMQKGKMVVWGGLTRAEKRREAKGKEEKGRYTHLNAEFQRIARRDKKAFLSDQCKEIEENNRMGKTRDLFKKIRYNRGTFHAKMGTIKDRNGMDPTEYIKKRWQEYIKELYKKDFHDSDNHHGVITHQEPDILKCKVKWVLESITMNKASGGDGIQVDLFQTLKDDAVKVLHSVCQQICKTQQWSQDWKRPVFIPIPKKGNAKTTA